MFKRQVATLALVMAKNLSFKFLLYSVKIYFFNGLYVTYVINLAGIFWISSFEVGHG